MYVVLYTHFWVAMNLEAVNNYILSRGLVNEVDLSLSILCEIKYYNNEFRWVIRLGAITFLNQTHQ